MQFKYKNILVLMLLSFVIWIVYTHTSQISLTYNLQCLNPVIQNGQFEDYPVPSEWELIQSTIHQRHLDRYFHLQ